MEKSQLFSPKKKSDKRSVCCSRREKFLTNNDSNQAIYFIVFLLQLFIAAIFLQNFLNFSRKLSTLH